MNYSHSDITVVVCTANRAKQAESFIRDFLKRFVKTQLIIVENSFSEEFFNHLTQEFEGESELIVLRSFPPGLSNARNLGLKHVKTKLVAFTDDDCVPENDWIESIIDSKLWNEVSAIGGKIVALNEVVTTNLSKIVRESLALLDHGNRIKVLDENEYIYGANMAFKFADVSCLQFKDSLGRKGSNLLSGEDIDFQIQMRNSGLKIGYDPTSIIKHEIELERLNPSWLMKRFAWQGATDAVMYGNGNQWLHDALEIEAEQLGVKAIVNDIFSDDWKNLDARLNFIRYFTATALKGKLFENRNFMSFYPPIYPGAKALVVDFKGFHDFILKSINVDSIGKYLIPDSPWEMTNKALESHLSKFDLIQSAAANVKTFCFISIDSFLHTNYFSTFLQWCIAGKARLIGFIHRIPADESQFRNLQTLSQFMEIKTFSITLREKLSKEIKNVESFSLPSQFPSLFKEKNSNFDFSNLTIAFPGEVRLFTQIQVLDTLLSECSEGPIKFKFRVIGGTRDNFLRKKMYELKDRYPEYLDLKYFHRYNSEYRVVPEFEFMKALRDCEFASKFQIEESANSSAVISDCLALKVPVITLRNTEAYRSISGFFDDLVMNSISGAELQRVVQNFTGFDEIAIDRELRNRRGQLIEGVLGKC